MENEREQPITGSISSSASTKKRARTAGAQVLLRTGFGCSPITGRALEKTIRTKRQQQIAQNVGGPDRLEAGEAAGLAHERGESAGEAAIDAGEFLRGDAHLVVNVHDVVPRDSLKILLPWRRADAAELDGGGADQELLIVLLEVE